MQGKKMLPKTNSRAPKFRKTKYPVTDDLNAAVKMNRISFYTNMSVVPLSLVAYLVAVAITGANSMGIYAAVGFIVVVLLGSFALSKNALKIVSKDKIAIEMANLSEVDLERVSALIIMIMMGKKEDIRRLSPEARLTYTPATTHNVALIMIEPVMEAETIADIEG